MRRSCFAVLFNELEGKWNLMLRCRLLQHPILLSKHLLHLHLFIYCTQFLGSSTEETRCSRERKGKIRCKLLLGR
ncbi:unnamed protein product [Amaranthus hypochondriacus]